MDASYLNDWVSFLLRWLHVIAAIVWIGTSFYFVALDNHLRPPKRRADEEDGVGGEAWEIHGGGFYRIEKYRVAPAKLPEPLHWFKWEAYTTWLSGFALFVAVYYVDADLYLIDPEVADLEVWQAIAISVGLLIAGWFVYTLVCRALRGREWVVAALLTVWVAATAYGLSQLFSGRGMAIQVGAMLGTIMVANVFFVIIPAHWELIRAKEQGREPDPAPAFEGKRRSVHNNYLTLPVLLAMISIHFPTVIGHDQAWIALVGLMAAGAWVRHFFNLRHAGRTVWAIPVSAAALVVVVAVLVEPDAPDTPAAGQPVSFAQVQGIVAERCAECHSTNPTNPSYSSAPAGVVLDTPEQIVEAASAIEEQAVLSRAMPLGNVTGMTDEERGQLAAWIEAGAPGE